MLREDTLSASLGLCFTLWRSTEYPSKRRGTHCLLYNEQGKRDRRPAGTLQRPENLKKKRLYFYFPERPALAFKKPLSSLIYFPAVSARISSIFFQSIEVCQKSTVKKRRQAHSTIMLQIPVQNAVNFLQHLFKFTAMAFRAGEKLRPEAGHLRVRCL